MLAPVRKRTTFQDMSARAAEQALPLRYEPAHAVLRASGGGVLTALATVRVVLAGRGLPSHDAIAHAPRSL